MTDRAGEEQLPRTDAEVAERDVAALQARLRAVEGERDAERAACAEGAHGAWEDVYRRLIGIYNRLTNKRWFIGVVRNSLQLTIKEHGPITPANLISAEKRIVGSILGEVLKEKQDATSLCSKCAHAEQRLADALADAEPAVRRAEAQFNRAEQAEQHVAGLRELVQDMMWASGAGHAIEQYRERARTLLTPPPPAPETHHDMTRPIWTPEDEAR